MLRSKHPNPFESLSVAASGAAGGQTLKYRSRPLPTHPGMKGFAREVLAVDIQDQQTLIDGLRGSDAVVHLAAMNAWVLYLLAHTVQIDQKQVVPAVLSQCAHDGDDDASDAEVFGA